MVRIEALGDRAAIHNVVRLAFGRDDEVNLVDALRDGGYVRASLIAEVERVVVGHILFSDLRIVGATGTVAALALAPLAVLPEYQRRGIGSQLIQTALDACREQGHRIVVVLGHPHFYQRFGFSSELARPSRLFGQAVVHGRPIDSGCAQRHYGEGSIRSAIWACVVRSPIAAFTQLVTTP